MNSTPVNSTPVKDIPVKKAAAFALPLLALAGLAAEVPVVGGRIVVEEAGAYTLSTNAAVTEVVFKTPGVSIVGDATLTMEAPAKITGGGAIATPLAGADGLAVDCLVAAPAGLFPQKFESVELWSQPLAADFSRIEAYIGGIFIGAPTLSQAIKATPVAYAQTGAAEATVQYQAKLASAKRAVGFKVRFSQAGQATKCEVLWCRRVEAENSEYYFTDWDAIPKDKLGGEYLPSPSYDLKSICLCRLSMRQDVALPGALPSGPIAFSGGAAEIAVASDMTFANRLAGDFGVFRFAGAAPGPDGAKHLVSFPALAERNAFKGELVFDAVDATIADQRLLAAGATLRLANGAAVEFSGEYKDGADGKLFLSSAEGHSQCHVGGACRLTFAAKAHWLVANQNQRFTVDGGVLALYSDQYICNLALLNGANVCGKRLCVGYYKSSVTRTMGETPCSFDAPILGNNGAGQLQHVFDTAADLVLNGGVGEYAQPGLAWVKRGAARLVIGGDRAEKKATGPLIVEEGSVALECANALSRTNSVTLAGGALETGPFANRLGTLALTANSTIVVGQGVVEFSDSSSIAWAPGVRLNLVGAADTLEPGHVRFLGEGLAPEQLAVMRYNGRWPVRIDASGHLIARPRGFVISLF